MIKDTLIETRVVGTRVDGSLATITRIVPPGTTPAPEPVPVPVPEPPVPPLPVATALARLTGLLGPTMTETEAAAAGLGELDAFFAKWEPIRWGDFTSVPENNRWATTNYYDRAAIYYAMWVRTGKDDYKTKADAIAVNYRDQYLIPNANKPAIWWWMHDGVALHALFNNDALSRASLLGGCRSIDGYAKYLPNRRDPNLDGRNRARLLTSYLMGVQSGDTSFPWAVKLDIALTAVLAHQDPDGAWRDGNRCGKQANFMGGMVADSLIRCDTHYKSDPRIAPAVKKQLDFLWNTQRKTTASGQPCFQYIEGECLSNGDAAGVLAPDLTGFFPHLFAWYARESGDESYATKARALLRSTFLAGYPQGSKQWNQSLAFTWRTLGYLKGL